MPKRKRRSFLKNLVKLFATGFIGFTLINWLEAQALKSAKNKGADIETKDYNNKTPTD